MASRGKKKTTWAKLNREAKLRDRRMDKQARKDARKQGITAEQMTVEQPSLPADGTPDAATG
jgi:hypothetical protein